MPSTIGIAHAMRRKSAGSTNGRATSVHSRRSAALRPRMAKLETS
jgi:hypothetical protein